MTSRLVVILPARDATKAQFRRWRTERVTGHTLTVSLEFDNDAGAMLAARSLPYVWAIENDWATTR